MNTAAKMETTSVPGRIHVSKETADILRKSGKGAWLEGRRGFDTFWANPRMKSPGSEGTSSEASQEFSEDSSEDALLLSGNVLPKKYKRLVDWNVEVLYELLENLVASRGFSSPRPSESSRLRKLEKMEDRQGIVLDEMTQILEMPDFDANRLRKKASISIPDCVKSQLHEYVSTIASLYRTTSKFHNFEHSSHVLMSAAKMMKRIVTPDSVDYERKHTDAKTRVLEIAKEVHDSTYGIASDSLMLFSIVFSALIHDVDHVGYTNGELCQLGTTASKTYRQRSVAEQNSVDLAWSLLMDERFVDLRNCIYTTEDELRRFRQLIVNALLAEDIADKELQQLRKNRWKQAFDESGEGDNNLNRRATIVFEYIIQASDVAHCMQHWNVYCKFNARLFEERYCAYLQGVAKDPSAGWYKGEIWFFDNYIIPTAEKLAQCGVFGVSSDEYLTYALQNRKTWESQGEQIVEQMVADCQTKYPSSSSTTAVEV